MRKRSYMRTFSKLVAACLLFTPLTALSGGGFGGGERAPVDHASRAEASPETTRGESRETLDARKGVHSNTEGASEGGPEATPNVAREVVREPERVPTTQPLVPCRTCLPSAPKLWPTLKGAGDAATRKFVDDARRLADRGDSRAVRLGTTHLRIFEAPDGHVIAIDPATHSVDRNEKTATSLLMIALREHVAQTPSGARFFTAISESTGELRFMMGNSDVSVQAASASDEVVHEIATQLIATSEKGSDLIFTDHPGLSDKNRDEIRELMFRVAEVLRPEGRRVLLDDLTAATLKRAAKLRAAKPNESFAALVPDKSFNVVDGNVIQNLAETLEARHIRIKHVTKDAPFKRPAEHNLIVLVVHSAPEMQAYVRRVSATGALRGKRVIFLSCGTPLTRELVHEMVAAGAEGVYSFRGTISATQAENFLDDFSLKRLDSNQALPDLLDESSQQATIDGLWQITLNVTEGRWRDVG